MKIKSIIATLFFCFGSTVAWAESIDEIPFTELEGVGLAKSEPVTLNKWRGQSVLVAFWRSDCPPCLQEIGIIPDIARHNADLPIALIALHDAEHARARLPKMPGNVHVLVTEGDAKEILAAFANDRTLALPYSTMLDASGKVCGKHYGIIAPDKIKEWRKQCS